MLPDEIKPAMHGTIPSTIVTCSLAGIPNVTDISQVVLSSTPFRSSSGECRPQTKGVER